MVRDGCCVDAQNSETVDNDSGVCGCGGHKEENYCIYRCTPRVYVAQNVMSLQWQKFAHFVPLNNNSRIQHTVDYVLHLLGHNLPIARAPLAPRVSLMAV